MQKIALIECVKMPRVALIECIFFQSYTTVSNTDLYLSYNFWATYYVVLTPLSLPIEIMLRRPLQLLSLR